MLTCVWWQNDVQMAVCLLLCLGDKYIQLIDQQLLQQWFLSYVGPYPLSVIISLVFRLPFILCRY